MERINKTLVVGQELETPIGKRPFKIFRIDLSGVVVQVGVSNNPYQNFCGLLERDTRALKTGLR